MDLLRPVAKNLHLRLNTGFIVEGHILHCPNLPASGGPVDTALVKVGGRWRHRKSCGPPVGRVEPVESAGGPVAYSAGPTPPRISESGGRNQCYFS